MSFYDNGDFALKSQKDTCGTFVLNHKKTRCTIQGKAIERNENGKVHYNLVPMNRIKQTIQLVGKKTLNSFEQDQGESEMLTKTTDSLTAYFSIASSKPILGRNTQTTLTFLL